MDAIIKKYLDKLKEFDEVTPVYFDIESPLNILYSYDEDELYKIIQFDVEFKNILEPFLTVCYTSRMLYENTDFLNIQKTLQDIVDMNYYYREIQLLDILRFISLYCDFIELKTDISMYYQNINKIIAVLNEILVDIEKFREETNNSYIYEILSANLKMLNNDIINNKIDLKKELRNIFKNKKRMEFSEFSLLFVEYGLAVFNQEKFLDSLCYIENVYKFITDYDLKNEIAKKIAKNYEEFVALFFENQQIQKRLYSGQSSINLI